MSIGWQNEMNKILVVDDELSIRDSFTLILEGKYRVVTAASGEGALKHLTDQKIDVVYLDIRMPGLNGLETLRKMKEIDPEVEVIMVTAVNDVSKASEAIKYGARDYIVKPFDVEAILKMTEAILRRKSLVAEGEAVQKETHKKTARIIGRSEKMAEIAKLVDKVAGKDLRVLITGEPGTEKEEIARLIHESSPRAGLPFLSFDLSARTPSTALFGAGTGTTTADLKKTPGIFEKVRGGTLFLNHIEYLPPELEPFKTVDTRLVAGSNPAEPAERSKEVFDFFSEVLVALPPLRERVSDLPLLVSHYLEKFSEKYGKEMKDVPPEVDEIFSNYDWPGNTEELKCLLERLVITVPSDRITAADLPIDLLLKSGGPYGKDYLSSYQDIAQGRTRTGTAYSAEGF